MLVQLAACRTDAPELTLSRYAHLFPAERLEAITSRPLADQRRTIAGQLALHYLLSKTVPEAELPPRFCYGWQDKPELADIPLHFNLSHSGEWAVCALCGAPVGVDIQQERTFRPILVKKFSKKEQIYFNPLQNSAKTPAFFDLWCLKEAYCKCTGDGLRTPLNASTFTLSPVSIDKAGFTPALVPFSDACYHLALCVQTTEPLDIQLTIL